ncbi:MAG: acyltransferase [Candidatus Roizmanbacteria bacterium]
MSFLTGSELSKLGFKSLGENVKISNKAVFYNTHNISIGDNTRIDDFCILSAGCEISIGAYVHISVYSSLIGKGIIRIEDHVALSGRTSLYSSNDDYSGEYLTNPTVSSEYTNVLNQDVVIEKHSIIGSGCVILPGSYLEKGVAVGSLSLIKGKLKEFGIYAGIPVKFIKSRSKNLLILEEKFIDSKLNV